MLVGNAGLLGTLTPLGHIEPKTWDEVMAVNVTANWRLIRSCDPLLRRSAAGRAIFVTSGVARAVRALLGPYAASKAALEMLVGIYAAEMAQDRRARQPRSIRAACARACAPRPSRARTRRPCRRPRR